jgi:hypothetical protein
VPQNPRRLSFAVRRLVVIATALAVVSGTVLPAASPAHADIRPVASTTALAKAAVVGTAPAIAGTVVVGKTVTAKTGTWKPGKVTLRYQWLRNRTPIRGATGSSYKLGAADAGQYVQVRVTGIRSGYASTTKTSPAKKVVGVLAGATPAIVGTVAAGKTVTVKAGTWKPGPVALRYQWMLDGRPIKGATGSRYTIKAAAAGHRLSVVVAGSKSGHAGVKKTSTAKVVATAAKPAKPRPANPGNSKDCGDFDTWRQAQDWYKKYFKDFGDVARLDGDKDGIACESLPGAP